MLSSSGFRDALGARDLRFDRESGEVRECLVLRPELAAYHRALRQRVSRLASIIDSHLAPVEDVQHEPATGRVTVVSQQVSGLRLQQILRSAREHELVPDLTIALFFTTELLSAAHVLHTQAAVPHGAIAADRVIVTPAGEIVLADYAFGEAIEAANFAPARLWREFGIAQWFGEPFSVAGDVRQSALTGVALMLGRPLDGVDMPDGLDALLIEVEEAAMIRGGRLFAEPVIAWLTRALGSTTYESADEAARACAALLTDRERTTARPALADFLEELDQVPVAPAPHAASAAPAAAVAEDLGTSEPRAAAAESAPQWTPEPEPETRWSAPEPAAETRWASTPEPEPEMRWTSEPEVESRWSPEPEPETERAAEPELEPEPAAVFTPEPLRAREPGRTLDIEPEPADDGEPDVVEEPVAVNGPMFTTRTDAPPAPAPSTSVWPPPPTPAFEVTPDAGPRIVSASPFSLVQGGARAKPVSTPPPSPPAPPAAPSVATPVSPPIAVPIARPIEPIPLPPLITPAALVTTPADEVTGSSQSIKLKGETGIRLKETLAPKRSSTSLGLDERSVAESSASGDDTETLHFHFRIPWKYVAAAFAVVATGFAATTMDWGSSAKSTEITKPPAPVALPPAPPATTGALQVLSNNTGSKVLIDGTIRGETPLTIDDLEPGRHVVIVRAPNGNVRRTVTITAGKTTTLDLAVYSGWVVVNAPIELQIFDGDKSIGNAGEGPIVLAAGPHQIVLVNEALGYRTTRAVDVQPGEEERIAVDPKGAVNLNAVPWAEVWMDGTKLGETPLGNVELPLGIREFTFKHPEYGERKVSATITGSATAQVTVDFTRQQ